jgi:hypothetical protein
VASVAQINNDGARASATLAKSSKRNRVGAFGEMVPVVVVTTCCELKRSELTEAGASAETGMIMSSSPQSNSAVNRATRAVRVARGTTNAA